MCGKCLAFVVVVVVVFASSSFIPFGFGQTVYACDSSSLAIVFASPRVLISLSHSRSGENFDIYTHASPHPVRNGTVKRTQI